MTQTERSICVVSVGVSQEIAVHPIFSFAPPQDDDDEAYLEGSSRGSRHSGGGGGRSRQASNSTPMSSFTNSLGTQQSRWKRQVQEQRRNIYDRHAMLN